MTAPFTFHHRQLLGYNSFPGGRESPQKHPAHRLQKETPDSLQARASNAPSLRIPPDSLHMSFR